MSSRSNETEKDSDTGLWILASFGLGAGLMYFFDPQAGRRRRALVRDQYDHMCRRLEEAQRVVVRDASHRAIGLMAQARRAIHAPTRAATARTPSTRRLTLAVISASYLARKL